MNYRATTILGFARFPAFGWFAFAPIAPHAIANITKATMDGNTVYNFAHRLPAISGAGLEWQSLGSQADWKLSGIVRKVVYSTVIAIIPLPQYRLWDECPPISNWYWPFLELGISATGHHVSGCLMVSLFSIGDGNACGHGSVNTISHTVITASLRSWTIGEGSFGSSPVVFHVTQVR